MIYLDTHVVVWLYAGLGQNLSDTVRQLINRHDILISPIVLLECQYLFEIEKIRVPGAEIEADLTHIIGLKVCKEPFARVVKEAVDSPWTRDPFDRLIVAHAAVKDAILLTKDQKIRAHYANARW